MPAAQNLLSIDFGSEYIRVSKTRVDPVAPSTRVPQVVEFNGRPELRNVIWLAPDLADYDAVGEDVFSEGLVSEVSERLHWSLTLDNAGEFERNQATALLLKSIHQNLELDCLSQTERAGYHTLVAEPLAVQPGVGKKWTERLRQVGFPNPQEFKSLQAILWAYLYPDIQPGRYMVIDCGASATRMACCRVGEEKEKWIRTEATKAEQPGGRDFDEVLLRHLDRMLTGAALPEVASPLKQRRLVEDFKRRFARRIADGEYALDHFDSASGLSLSLHRDDFESSGLAGGLISQFRHAASHFLAEYNVDPGSLDGILIAGGGAHWPFVKEWAIEIVGAERVYLDDYPEEVVVRGLPLLVDIRVGQPPDRDTPGTGPKPDRRPQDESTPSSPGWRTPGCAFWIELVGALFGMMGLGRFFVLQNVLGGCLSVLGWWAVLGISLAGLIALSAAESNPAFMLILLPIWLSGSVLSAFLVRRAAIRENSKTGGV